MENETLEQQTNAKHNVFENFIDSASQNEVIENKIDDKIRKALDNAISTVKNRMHDAILTAIDKVVIPRVETAVSSITGSSGYEPNSEVQNPDRRDFLGNAGNTALLSAFSRLDLNTNQDRNDEACNEKNFEDGDFPVLGPNYNRRTQTHHMVTGCSTTTHHKVTGHNAPHNSIPEYLTGQIQTQNDSLLQQFTQLQNMATHISPNNTLPMVEQTPQRQKSDPGNPINRLAESIAGIASRQRSQTSSTLLKPTNNSHTKLRRQKREIWTV